MGDMHLTQLPGPTASTSRRRCKTSTTPSSGSTTAVLAAQARLGEYLEWAAALQHPGGQNNPADLTGPGWPLPTPPRERRAAPPPPPGPPPPPRVHPPAAVLAP